MIDYRSVVKLIAAMNQEMQDYRSVVKLVAVMTTSSSFWTRIGSFRQPGDLRIFWSSFNVLVRTFGGHMSEDQISK